MLGVDGAVAIEVKGATVRPSDLKGLLAYMDEHPTRHAIVVCNETAPRRTAAGVWLLPWERFLERLWADDLLD